MTPNGRLVIAPKAALEDVSRLEGDLDAGNLGGATLRLIGRRQLRSCNSWLHNAPKMVSGKPRCTLLVHPTDAEAVGIASGDRVQVRSRVGSLDVPAQVDPDIMPGVVSLPHGWGHRRKGAKLTVANATEGESVNDLTDEAFYDALTGNAGLNGVPVTLTRLD